MNILEARRRTLGKGVYKKTVEGNPAIAQGSLARRYPGIAMQGWTEQAQYEGKNLFNPEQFYDKNTYSEKSGNYYLTTWQLKPNTVYRFTVYNNHVSPEDNGVMFFGFNDAFNNHNPNGSFVVFTSSDEKTTIENSGESGVLFVKINSKSDPETQLELLKNANVIISEGAEKIPYEPYTGGQPSPNPDYPQEITSAGKYDEGTGKYQYTIKISDSEESPTKSQTVILTADRPLTKWDKLEKRNGQWGWVYKSAEIVLDGDESVGDTGGAVMTTIPFRINGIKGVPNSVGTIVTFSDKLQGILNSNWNNGNAQGVYLMYDGQLVVRINASYLSTSERSEYAQAFKEWLSENNVKVLYETAEETFVPLSASEQEAMNALHTFRPTTVLSNDCDCNMTLTYKTKKSMQSAPGGGYKEA